MQTTPVVIPVDWRRFGNSAPLEWLAWLVIETTILNNLQRPRA